MLVWYTRWYEGVFNMGSLKTNAARPVKVMGLLLMIILLLISVIGGCASRSEHPTIADYWGGDAGFEVYYQEAAGTDAASYHGICGISMAVVDDTWYRFNRYLVDDDGKVRFGINCRQSTDKGLTWSEPVHVVEPTKGTPWALYATDGHAIYDEKANKWRLLFQSISEFSPWTCSYLEREGSDPMGLFTTPEGFVNPAINSGEIWNQIGESAEQDCIEIAGATWKIAQEGTPEIVDVVDGTYYVTFHGAASFSKSVHGFRGIATTTDFQTYTAAANDSIFDEYDALDWHVEWKEGGPVGGGHATYIKDGDYWYTIIECPDVSLSPTTGATQNWPFGLLRSKEVTSTEWENYSDNPMSEFQGTGYVCEWQYARLFKDGDVTYLAVSKMEPETERSFRIYQLTWK